MNIVLTTIRQAALEREALAQSTTENPLTADELAAKLLNSACDSYASAHANVDLLAMSGDDDLVAAGLKAMRATPEKKAAAIAAFDQALASAPSR